MGPFSVPDPWCGFHQYQQQPWASLPFLPYNTSSVHLRDFWVVLNQIMGHFCTICVTFPSHFVPQKVLKGRSQWDCCVIRAFTHPSSCGMRQHQGDCLGLPGWSLGLLLGENRRLVYSFSSYLPLLESRVVYLLHRPSYNIFLLVLLGRVREFHPHETRGFAPSHLLCEAMWS